MKKALALGVVLLFAAWIYGQTTQKRKSVSSSGQQQSRAGSAHSRLAPSQSLC
jgi:hypothetical protein